MPIDLNTLKQIIHEAGRIIREVSISREQISSKEGHRNFVTSYDIEVQDFLESRFRKLWPDYHFVAEEQDTHKLKQQSFIVDPIDGTSNFIFGIPFYCISVAVTEKGKVVQGTVYNPVIDEMFWAEEGKGAYLNDKPIKNPDLPMDETVFGVGSSPYNDAGREPTLNLIRDIWDKSDFRRLGSAALDLCYVASGRQGGYFELDIAPWDIAAGMLIAREAGATVTTLEGKEPPLDRSMTILAAGPKVYAEMQKLLGFKSCF